MKIKTFQSGQSLVELLLAIGVLSLIIPAIFVGIIASRQGKTQQVQRLEAVNILHETNDAIRSIRESGWSNFAMNGIYHPVITGNSWVFSSGAFTDADGFTRQVVVSDVYRLNGVIVASGTNGAAIDPSTKQAITTVSWGLPYSSSISTTLYVTRYLDNLTYLQTTQAQFNTDTLVQTQTTNSSGGEVILGFNNKAKWCSPSFSSSTINLPDGPPVAVAATASAQVTIPNDVYVATSPYTTNSAKLAYVQIPANVDPPSPILKGTFTLDATKYSAGTYPANLGTLTNNFNTTDVKFYTSSSGKKYALLGTNLPDHEVLAIQIYDGTTDAYQDPLNHIYKYWTYFNTRQYQGDSRSTPNQDQSPFGYGTEGLAVLNNKGYVDSGGYLYTFDLSNIDSKSSTNGLDEVGCRIQLDGYDCQPNNGTDMKYGTGKTGTGSSNFSDTTSPAHPDCTDGGNIELNADHQMSAVQVGNNTYVYVAVGAGTNPELDIADVTSIPTGSSSPVISNNSCGRQSGGNSGWKVVGSLDFDPANNTEEAANSVYAKSDGTRAYMSSNGGIMHNGIPDSDQFYIIDTSNKTAPKFLSTWQTTVNGQHYANTAESGYYSGTNGAPNGNDSNAYDIQLYPRRALTVLNGSRAVLVGQDGVVDGNEPHEYQVLNLDNESSPTYCGGVNFSAGFNDLTSVTEADFDTFVYMVANTPDKQLKIIQGGPDGTYADQGTIESNILDIGYSTAFNRYTATFSTPTNTSIKFQFAGADAVNGSCTNATYVYTGPDGTTGSYYTNVNGPIFLNPGAGGYKNPARCFRYKAYLSTTDYNATPVLSDMTINYSP